MDFAQLALHHESINCSPFELLFGRQPRLNFDWKAPEKPENARQFLSYSEAKKAVHRMQEAWKWDNTYKEKDHL